MNAELVRELFHYDAESGVLRWLVRPARNVQVGDVAGSLCSGYWNVGYRGRAYRAHRLAWLHVHGVWPLGEIDHIDGDKANNRISNLRDTSHALNLQNLKRAYRNSKTGLLGVSAHRSKFKAQIAIDGKQRNLGSFLTPIEAHGVYMEARKVRDRT